MKRHAHIKTVAIVPRASRPNDSLRISLSDKYLKIFADRGINHFIIPFSSPDLKALLDMCDGVLVPGGDDIDPKYYGEENEGLSHGVDELIDTLDKDVIEYCIEKKKPMLGICRGIQSIAAFMGGSLYQDIPSAGLTHDVIDHTHDVIKTADTPLSVKLPDSFRINSYHHQSVKDLPEGFVTTFMHNDVIEAIEHKTLPIIGIQWHPERFDTEESKIIFDYFCGLL